MDEHERLIEEEAYCYGVMAAVYGYPAVAMYRTRYSFCFDPKSPIRTPVNSFRHRRQLLDASFRAVVSANSDTLYSSAWLDLSEGPIVLSMPEFGDRYHSFHLMDIYSNTVAVIHRRASGAPSQVALVGPGWEGTLPPGMGRVEVPTVSSWMIARILVDGAADVPAVNGLQAECRLTPLAHLDSEWSPPDKPSPGPAWEADNPLRAFACLNAVLRENPPPAREAAMMSNFRRIGVGPDLDPEAASAPVARGLARAWETGTKLITEADTRPGRLVNGWYLPPADLGEFGDDFLFRAEVAMKWMAPVPMTEAVYLIADTDAAGEPLHGAQSYRLSFPAGSFPPADSFWSLTLYRLPGRHFYANPLKRVAVGDRSGHLQWGADGSLDIEVSHATPGPERESNWLPAPEGPFNLILRGYVPRPEMITGEWAPPPVIRIP